MDTEGGRRIRGQAVGVRASERTAKRPSLEAAYPEFTLTTKAHENHQVEIDGGAQCFKRLYLQVHRCTSRDWRQNRRLPMKPSSRGFFPASGFFIFQSTRSGFCTTRNNCAM